MNPSTIWLALGFLFPLAAVAAGPTERPAADPWGEGGGPSLAGLVVRVDGIDSALSFYRDVAGFDVVDRTRYPDLVELRSGPVALVLRKVAHPVHHRFPGVAEAHLNLEVESLAATLADLRRRSVPELAAEPLKAVIGPNMPILDPAGNILYVIELYDRAGPLPRPRVFNYGITVTEMAKARSFYEGVLGFRVFSEEYYPPVIPFVRSGALSVVLHESADEVGAAPAPDRAQMNLLFQVVDLDATLKRLAAAGVEIRRPMPTLAPLAPLGPYAEIVDPFGNVHVLLERGRPSSESGGDGAPPAPKRPTQGESP